MAEPDTTILPLAIDLAIVSGPGRGRSIRLPVGTSLVVGRADTADERLGGDQAISRRHARLEHPRPGQVVVADLGSTNGVYLGGQRISKPTEIRPGDRIELGDTMLVVGQSESDVRTEVHQRVDTPPLRIHAYTYDDELGVGYALLDKGQPAAADAAFARASMLAPQRPEGHLGRGLALIELDRLEEASRALGDAVRRDQRLAEGWYQLGVISERKGDAQQALGYYSHVLTIDDAHPAAAERMATLRQRSTASLQPSPATRGQRAEAVQAQPPIARPQPNTLAEAAEAAAKGEAPATWDHGALVKAARRAPRSFGWQWLSVIALLGLAFATKPLLLRLVDAVPSIRDREGERSALETFVLHLYDKRGMVVLALLVLAGLASVCIVLASFCTTYHVYERRIDFSRGVLFRRKSSLWLYDVTDIEYERSGLMLLTNTAVLALSSSRPRSLSAGTSSAGARRPRTSTGSSGWGPRTRCTSCGSPCGRRISENVAR